MEKEKNRTDFFDVDEAELAHTLDDFLADEEKIKGKSHWNFANIAGLVFLISAVLYGIHSLFGVSIVPDIIPAIEAMPVVGIILIFLVGFGLIASSKTSKSKKKKKNATPKTKRQKQTNSDKQEPIDAYGYKSKNKLYRSRTNNKIFGVCGGIANYFCIDATFVRVAFVIGAIYYTAGIWMYLALAFFMDKEPKDK